MRAIVVAHEEQTCVIAIVVAATYTEKRYENINALIRFLLDSKAGRNVTMVKVTLRRIYRPMERLEARTFRLRPSAGVGPESDIDLMVTFALDAHPSLFDLVAMQDELKIILERDVDLVDRRSVEQSHSGCGERRS